VVAAGGERLPSRLDRGKALWLDHAAADEGQQYRRRNAEEEHVAPTVGADPIVDVGREQIAKAAAGHHEAEDFRPVGFGEGLGDERDGDHQLGAGAKPGDEAETAQAAMPPARNLAGR